ncbi:DUF2062 domain-containing protein [Halopiger xanaduensis]|uniref:DUF2062 domain-containing protein n=1 Tax=Halopiger xanaduensis (strain DSM 18323 / JCM 14033 / SH-6) TaxID=797210 RepID=F8DCV2_HALXS|nr:DUF2062 domain-containing protein [Halopiger xanaduensis]AEH37281.1 Protein of unknown function DUF2062 [Halopiger xanaduensis SH-6]
MRLRERLGRYRERAREELTAAFREERTPHQIAASFATGVFVTALPTGGFGVGLFFVFCSLWSWVSKPAIFASVAVLNPFVKPAVYVASFQLGGLVLGTGPVPSSEVSVDQAGTAARQLLVGNVVVALALAAIGYVLLLRVTQLYRRRDGQLDLHRASALPNYFRR